VIRVVNAMTHSQVWRWWQRISKSQVQGWVKWFWQHRLW